MKISTTSTTSSLVTRMTTDVTNVQNAYMMIIRTAIRAPLMLVFAFAMAFRHGRANGLDFPVRGAVSRRGAGLGHPHGPCPCSKRCSANTTALNRSVQENIQAMRVVKSFVREDYEEEKFARGSGGCLYRLHPGRADPGTEQPA